MDGTSVLGALHDLSLAAWFGGSWMGAVGLNGATIEVDDHTQRTRVANAGWFGWAPVAGVSAATHVASAYALGRLSRADGPVIEDAPSSPARHLRTAATAAALLATLGTGVSGRRVVRGGDVPVATAVRPISSTPPEIATAQRRLRVAQWAVPVLTGSLFLFEAFQSGGKRDRAG